MSELPRKMRVEHGGHTIEGDVEYTQGPRLDAKMQYSLSLSLTNGLFLCGPHDAEGNHIEEEA